MTVLLEIEACLYQSYSNLVRISRKQRIHLLNVLPHKLVTPLSINDMTSALPRVGHTRLPISLAGVHLVRLCIVSVGFTIRE